MYYAESDPYQSLSLAQMAAILGVSTRTLAMWRAEGCPIGAGIAAIRAWRRTKRPTPDPRGSFRYSKAYLRASREAWTRMQGGK